MVMCNIFRFHSLDFTLLVVHYELFYVLREEMKMYSTSFATSLCSRTRVDGSKTFLLPTHNKLEKKFSFIFPFPFPKIEEIFKCS